MYKDYFRLVEMPFSIAPDPRFLYMSSRHREALAHLLFGVQGEGGIVLLTGEVGTGKTTLCRCLLEQIDERCDVAFILNPKMSARELLCAICDEFHVPIPSGADSVKLLVDAINAHLLKANSEGRRAVLIVDEAQNLMPDVLEQLRLLTNLETSTRKLLQIILIGQPELQSMLARTELRQVSQRIVARYHLTHLTRLEVASYVVHRLSVSGAQLPLIPYSLVGLLFRLTGGVPRLINLVCDRALLGTYVRGLLQVTPKILKLAAGEVSGVSARRMWWGRLLGWPLASFAVLCAGGVFAATLLPVNFMLPAGLLDPEQPAFRPAQATVVDTTLLPASRPTPRNDPLDWPEGARRPPDAHSEKISLHQLLTLHGVASESEAVTPPCVQAEESNLQCMQRRGLLSDLSKADQPAVLLLQGKEPGRTHFALLSELSATGATVSMDSESRRVALPELLSRWTGHYVLLRPSPSQFDEPLTKGSRGPAVLWVRRHLANLHGGARDGPALFDEALSSRVRAFQQAQGMQADGVAGIRTVARLRAVADERFPHLAGLAGGGSHVVHP